MPSLPCSKRWNFSLYSYFPNFLLDDTSDNSPKRLAAFYASLLFTPLCLTMCVISWPLDSWPVDDLVANATPNATVVPHVSHRSYIVFQMLYLIVSFPVMAVHSAIAVPGMPPAGFVVALVAGLGMASGYFFYEAHEEPRALNPTAGVFLMTMAIGVCYLIFIVLKVKPRPYCDRIVGMQWVHEQQRHQHEQTLRHFDSSSSGHGGSGSGGGDNGDVDDTPLVPSTANMQQAEPEQDQEQHPQQQQQQQQQPAPGDAREKLEGLSPDEISSFTVSKADLLLDTADGACEERDAAMDELDEQTQTGAVERAFLTLMSWSEYRVWHAILSIFVVAVVFFAYLFCVDFTTGFFPATPRGHGSDRTGGEQIVLYALFAAAVEFFCVIARVVGRITDMTKWKDGASTEVILEVAGAAFLSVFKTSLFQHLASTSTLVALLLLHVAQHALIYPVRLTRAYFLLSSRAQERMLRIPGIGSALYDPSTLVVWRARLNLDLMLRFVVSQAACVTYIVIMTFLRFGDESIGNQRYYGFVGIDLSDEAYARTVVFLALNVVLELALIGTVHMCAFDLLRPLARLCSHEKMYWWYAICIVGHVSTDVFLVRALIRFPDSSE